MMMPAIKYTFMEKLYDINSNMEIRLNKVDTSQFITETSIKDLCRISLICGIFTLFMTVNFIGFEENVDLREFVTSTCGYIIILLLSLLYVKLLENKKLSIAAYTTIHKYLIVGIIEISSLINLVFLEHKGYDTMFIIRTIYFEYFFIYFLTVLLKLEDYGYCATWLVNFYFTCCLEYRLDVKLLLEKFFVIIICITSILIHKETHRQALKNYIIHKKTLRYIDHLINKMFCLFFSWNDNKFVFINKSAKNFINNKFDSNDQDTSPEDDNYDMLCKVFLSSIKFTYLNKELHKDQDPNEYTLLKALKSFESQDRTLNHDMAFIGVIEYIHPAVQEKYFFNVFFRTNVIADIRWIEIFMYDITLNQKIETIDQTIKIKEKILSKIAHEFKTPLICVISLTEKLKTEVKALQMRTTLVNEIKQINDLSNYTLLLINDLAFYLNSNARLLDGVLSNINNNKFYQPPATPVEYNQIVLHKEDIHISEILKFVFRILETLLLYKGNTNINPIKDFKTSMSHLVIHTDPLRLKQILLNLVSNAVKFTKSGFIKLTAKMNVDENYNKELIISVEDSGLGIREEDMDKLFKDYKMLDRQNNINSMGSGLGLSISNQLANLLGYKISVVSTYTLGSIFSLSIKIPPNLLYPPRKQSCPTLTQRTIFRLNNCTFSKNLEEQGAINILKSNKRNIKRLLSGYITNKSWRKSRHYLPMNTNIVHISNSNFNFNNYDKEEKNITGSIELISNQDSSSSDIDDQLILPKSDTDSTTTVEGLYPINMDEVRKMLNNTYVKEDKPEKIRKYSSRNKVSSRFSSEKRNIKFPSKEIVIVDDNSILLSTLKNLILKVLQKNKLTDVKVTCGCDGIDLLKIIMDDQKKENIVKLVFVDEFMDFMNGSEAIHIIRDLEKKNKIKPLYIVKISAMSLDGNLDGANCILEKPARENQIKMAMIQAGIMKDDIDIGLPINNLININH
jgi:signal transduction histidine kinase